MLHATIILFFFTPLVPIQNAREAASATLDAAVNTTHAERFRGTDPS